MALEENAPSAGIEKLGRKSGEGGRVWYYRVDASVAAMIHLSARDYGVGKVASLLEGCKVERR